MRGHPYVKSAIDMACWDIFGKACGQSVRHLLGGRYWRGLPALPRHLAGHSREMAASVAKYRARGLHKFQLKVGGDPDTDIERIRHVSAKLERGDVLDRRRQYRLDAA